MARVVKQYRYYNDNNLNNQPIDIRYGHFVDGSVFELPSCYPILQLGIQALPGTEFYLNTSPDPIVIGFTGIYELDLENQLEIVKISFSKDSMEAIRDNQNGYLIVDILYDNGEEEDE